MITILDVAKAEGAQEDAAGGINAGEFLNRGLPFLAGCQRCHATLAPYNAYPSKNGYISCKECLGDAGFETVTEFHAFCQAGDDEAR